MDYTISPPLFVVSWLLGMLLLMELGRRLGRRRLARDPEKGLAGQGAVEGSVFALFGLLLAFTFSGGASRLDQRRELIAEEANAIGTAYLRLDLLPPNDQPALRDLFRGYVDSRLAVYRALPDVEAAKAEIARSEEFQRQIWARSVAATREPGAHVDAGKLLLPALNDMIDITTTRTMAMRIHPPVIIYGLLLVLGLGCSLLAGLGMTGERRSWIHMLGFTAIMVVSLYVILAIEYPRHSFIQLEAYDNVLVEVREKMK